MAVGRATKERRWIALVGALALSVAAARGADCERLTGMKLEHSSVTRATAMAAGAVIERQSGDPAPAARVAYCRIEVTSKPSSDSDIRIELWVPSGAAWNGKFEQVGNGGFAGAVPYRSMTYGLSMGYAVAGTDDGHQSPDMTDASWVVNHPEKLKDFGWRAIHDTAVDAKALILALTKKRPAKAYFYGCSDGGREALMMAERYPTYFDGIIAGAPFFAATRMLSSGALRAAELDGKPARFSRAQLALLQHRVLESCGQGAAYLKDPRQCHIDVSALQCKQVENDSCLSAAEVKTAEILYRDDKDPLTGKILYGVLPGAEAVDGGWESWLTGDGGKARPYGMGFSWNYMAYMVMQDPSLDPGKVTAVDVARGERQISPFIDAQSADLSVFRKHGGKLILYHGWNDPAIAPGYSIEYSEALAAKTGSLDFYRLYMVPGMLHCGGGDAPTQVNWQAVLEAWVEKGTPPGNLTASDGKGATQLLAPFN